MPEDYEKLHDMAYAKYQLYWMQWHGFSLSDLIQSLWEFSREAEEPYKDSEALFAQWMQDSGFHGELWACKDEFLETEYPDPDFAKNILTEHEYNLYLTEMKE